MTLNDMINGDCSVGRNALPQLEGLASIVPSCPPPNQQPEQVDSYYGIGNAKHGYLLLRGTGGAQDG